MCRACVAPTGSASGTCLQFFQFFHCFFRHAEGPMPKMCRVLMKCCEWWRLAVVMTSGGTFHYPLNRCFHEPSTNLGPEFDLFRARIHLDEERVHLQQGGSAWLRALKSSRDKKCLHCFKTTSRFLSAASCGKQHSSEKPRQRLLKPRTRHHACHHVCTRGTEQQKVEGGNLFNTNAGLDATTARHTGS